MLFDGYEILDVFMSSEIDRLARKKPEFIPGPHDIGCLMDFLPALRMKRLYHSNNHYYQSLEKWKNDFKTRKIPFIVLRTSERIVKLYKERKADNKKRKGPDTSFF